MSEIFNNVNLENAKAITTLTDAGFAPLSDYSVFPASVDKLKEIQIESTGFNSIQEDLKMYYSLLIKFLNNPGALTSLEKENLNRLTKSISRYALTSGDYVLLRDSLMEVRNYLETISTNLIGENGVYPTLQESLFTFEDDLNGIITQLNEIYQASNGEITHFFPEGSITSAYLSDELKSSFNYLEVAGGVYIDRSEGEITWPKDQVSVPPMIIKLKHNV